MTLVSIVTPAYNAARHIEATAQTVFAQTYANWEWIIADDGSTDATREIVANWNDPRVALIEGEHSGLPAVGRNRAMQRARGEYVAFLDADDLWMPDKLASQLHCFASHPEVGLVFSKVRYMYDEVGRTSRSAGPELRGVPNPGMLFDALCAFNRIAASSAVVRRSLLEPFDEDLRQRGTEDYELWLRLAPRAPFAWVERPLVLYRVEPQSVSGNAVAIARGRILALEKAGRPAPLPRARFWLGHAQLRDGVEHCGRAALWQAARAEPRHAAAWLWLALSFLGPSINRFLRRLAYRLV